MSITKTNFGKVNGTDIDLFILKNANGTTLTVSTYGAAMVNIFTADKDGKFDDVILGFDDVDGYIKYPSSQGSVVGRFANRIKEAKFTLNGVEYQLVKNDGNNHIHGGETGYDARIWNVLYTNDSEEPSVSLTLTDPDGFENYPGNLEVNVVYTLTKDDAVKIDYYAETDKDTIINLTNHTYFNLGGYKSGKILDHLLQINAEYFTPNSTELIPTGEIRAVKGTPMDFTTAKPIGRDIDYNDEQIQIGHGYDHNFITGESGVMKHIATATDPKTGRIMDVYSTKPAVQLYIAHFLADDPGKNGSVLCQNGGFCLETQFYPDSPNHPEFPSCVLKAGDKYHHTTIFKFSK